MQMETKQNKIGVVILTLDKTKDITRDKEGQFIMIKWSIQQEASIYAHKTEAPKYI